MPNCQKCNYNFPPKELRDGYCIDCLDPEIREQEKKIEIQRSILEQEEYQKKQEEYQKIEKAKIEDIKNRRNSMFVTTETHIDIPIEKRIGIVSAQCVYGINIIKEVFGFIRDIVGGRVDSIEVGLDKANTTVIKELKEKAILSGGDAIIAVKIEHTYNNANNGSILSVFATGTVVKFVSKQ